MSARHRIRTIYGKELVDILRDKRTLIAMIVVPIVLYPLLMLGSIQAVSFQADAVEREGLVIGVISEQHGWRLSRMISTDNEILAQQRAALDPDSDEAASLPHPIEGAKTAVFDSTTDLEQAIRDRQIQVGVVFDRERLIGVAEYDQQVGVEFLADLEEVRSASAERRIAALIERVSDRMRQARLARERLPAAFVRPFVTSTVNLSSPPSILGQILPLILILMTITGAIYPAIDLTAGERERGTLESLMVCPVPVIDLVVGKFLVVTTVAIMGAALNLASVSATVYFGGFDRVIAKGGGGVPLGTMALILLCLVPFAVLMSAIMIAVCSYARTFKEAQNYVTPVILAVLIPGGIAALPATRLEGIMMVMPVGNMVLLARDLLLGAALPASSVALVLLSTTLYAGAAVAVAANIFGQESVVFADAGSLRASLSRRTFKPALLPSVSTSVLVVALLFPAWFFVQSALSPDPGESAIGLLYSSGWLMPLFFVALPTAILLYTKVGVATAFSLRMPSARHLAAAVLIGISAWVPAHELSVLQQSLLGTPQVAVESAKAVVEALTALPIITMFLLIALVPAVCEEILFRGFLLSGLGCSGHKWTSILVSAAIFGIFHFFLFKFVVTATLGVLLGYMCWQSRSVLPAIVAHFLHNAIGSYSAVEPRFTQWLGLPADAEWAHLPPTILIGGGVLVVAGVMLMSREAPAIQHAPTSRRVGTAHQ